MRFLKFSVLFFAIISCSKKENVAEQSSANLELNPTQPQEQTVSPTNVAKHEGLVLIEGSDCLTCHKVDSKLIGPSYQEVAAKYTEADIDAIVDKIINGGKGNWGDVPMAPHTGLTKENAKKMVQYIMTLKK